MMTTKMTMDAISMACLEALEELQISDDAAGDSQIKLVMLSAKKAWQQEAVFLAMQKIREKISLSVVPPSDAQMTKPVGAKLAEIR